MATVGLLSFSDGRDFAHATVLEASWRPSARSARALEANGHTVVAGDEPVWSNELAVREARSIAAAGVDCVVFNFSVWAFPHFAMLAATEIRSPLILLSTLDPARPGLVAMLAVAGGLDQVGRGYARVWGDIADASVRDRLEAEVTSARAVSSLRGTTFGRIGGRPMGMYTATAGTDTWMAQFGIDVEEVDQLELVRRAEEADPAEARRGPRLARGELPRGPLRRRAAHARAARAPAPHVPRDADLIEDLRLDFTGIKGQPELTTHFATADVAEALLNDPYDWNGPKAAARLRDRGRHGRRADDAAAAVTVGHPGPVRGRPPLPPRPRDLGPLQLWPACHLARRAILRSSGEPGQVELFPAAVLLPGRRRLRLPRRRPGRVHLRAADPRRGGATGCIVLRGRRALRRRGEPGARRADDADLAAHVRPPRSDAGGVPRDVRLESHPRRSRRPAGRASGVCALLDIDCIEL